MFNLGGVLGPPAAVLITSTGPAGLLWLVLGTAAALTAAVMLVLDYRLHHQDDPGRTRLRPQPA